MTAIVLNRPLRALAITAASFLSLLAHSGEDAEAAKKPFVEKVGAWQLICTAKKAPRVCHLRQTAKMTGTKLTIIGWDLAYEKGKLVSMVYVPNGVAQDRRLTVTWPDGATASFDYQQCTKESGCAARIDVPKAVLGAKPSKKKVEFVFYDKSKKAYSYALSLNGFQKGVAGLKP